MSTFKMRSNLDGSTWGPYESYWRQRHSEALLHDAEFRARNPGMARSRRVALVSQLDHLDPDLAALAGEAAARAERERSRTERSIHGYANTGSMPPIEILDGGFPVDAPANIVARARLQAHRDAGATHCYVRFDFTGPPLWLLLSLPPWRSPPALPEPRVVSHDSLVGVRRPRTPRWIR
jgi:hypothetical protein